MTRADDCQGGFYSISMTLLGFMLTMSSMVFSEGKYINKL